MPIGLNPERQNEKRMKEITRMLTTIVCLVALLGNPGCTQKITFTFTQAQVEEFREEFPASNLKTAVCTHLNRAVQMGTEE